VFGVRSPKAAFWPGVGVFGIITFSRAGVVSGLSAGRKGDLRRTKGLEMRGQIWSGESESVEMWANPGSRARSMINGKRVSSGLGHLLGVIGWMLVVSVFSGCAFDAQYRVKTSQPWPDEWASGPRIPYDRVVQLTAPTVEWHRKANWSSIGNEIARLLASRRDLYGFTRTGVAQATSSMTGQQEAASLQYLEVKVGPCFFDFTRPPPRVSIDYENKPFSQAMADLMGRAGRNYLISPDLADRRPITAHLANVDWREAAVRVMLDANVFVEPVWYNPVSLRSYEYGSQPEFLAAVKQAIENMRNPSAEMPLTIVPWDQWVGHNRAYQIRYDLGLRSQSTSQPLGPPAGAAILSSDLAIAKKQIIYALPFQLKLTMPTTNVSSPGVSRP